MPRYFFHLFNDKAFVDSEGSELPNIPTARQQGIAMAGQMMASHEIGHQSWTLYIVDDERQVVGRLAFEDRGF